MSSSDLDATDPETKIDHAGDADVLDPALEHDNNGSDKDRTDSSVEKNADAKKTNVQTNASDELLKFTRNFGIAAHVDAGKTTSTERILFYCGVVHKIGEVHDGAAVMDFMAQEKERGITIQAAATTCYWESSRAAPAVTLASGKKQTKEKYRLNLIDTPGHIDFTSEVSRALRVLDGAIILFDAVEGVETQTKTVWGQAHRHHIPRICFVNKMDRGGANFERTVSMMKSHLDANPIVTQLPVGVSEDFHGVIDLITKKYLYWSGDKVAPYEEKEIPDDMKEAAEVARAQMIEKALEADEVLLERYLDGYELSDDEIRKCIRKATLNLIGFPVFCGTAFKNKGVQLLLDGVIDYLPAPCDLKPIIGTNPENEEIKIVREQTEHAPFVGLVFKITVDAYGVLAYMRIYAGKIQPGDMVWNASTGKKVKIGRILQIHAQHRENINSAIAGQIVGLSGLEVNTGNTLCDLSEHMLLEPITPTIPVITMAIEPAHKLDQDKMINGLLRLHREDPSFVVATDQETGQTTISGSGQLHLEIMIDRLKRESNVLVVVGAPKVSYREYFTQEYTIDYKHQKQSGGAGQFAVVKILFEPMRDENNNIVFSQEFEFESKMKGQNIDSSYIPSIKDGINKAREKGIIAGYLLGGFKATLLDGAQHAVDSSAHAFAIAGRDAFREAMKHTEVRLLEPIMCLTVTCSADQSGTVMGDISRRRGQINSQETERITCTISAFVPLQELFNYVSDLRALTSGQAAAGMEFSHYAPAPSHIMEKVIKERGMNRAV